MNDLDPRRLLRARWYWFAVAVVALAALVVFVVRMPESTDSRRSRAVAELHNACSDVYRGLLADDLNISGQARFLANARGHADAAISIAGSDDERLLAVVKPIAQEVDQLGTFHDDFPRLPIFSDSTTSTVRSECRALTDSGL